VSEAESASSGRRPPDSAGPDPARSPAATRRLHEESILVDGHNDLAWRIRERWGLDLRGVDLDTRLPDGHTDIPRLRAGGVDVQFWAAYVPVEYRGAAATRVAREQIDLIRRMVAAYPADLELAATTGEIRAAVRKGKIASVIGVEGGHAIDDTLDVLREFYASGVRYLTLTHSASLDWADAAGDTPRAGGLSTFGRSVIAEMNRLGMLVDISHVTDETMHDVLDATSAPVIFSHSSARAVADHPRNVPDDVLRRVSDNGGVVMVNFFSGFLTPEGARSVPDLFAEEARIRSEHDDLEAVRSALAAWFQDRVRSRGSVATIVDHIDHIVHVAGIDHVGLGSDFDGIPITPEGMEDVSRFPAVTDELVRRGYTDEGVRGVLGENLLRVMHEVEDLGTDPSGRPSDD